jgi:hypothetical protein
MARQAEKKQSSVDDSRNKLKDGANSLKSGALDILSGLKEQAEELVRPVFDYIFVTLLFDVNDDLGKRIDSVEDIRDN